MGKISSYRELKIWHRSKQMAVEIYNLTKDMPEYERYGLISQLRRSAVSIPSNIAEGWGRNTPKYFISFMRSAMGSLFELITQIEIAQEVELINNEKATIILKEYEEIGKMINKLIEKVNSSDIVGEPFARYESLNDLDALYISEN